MLEAPELEQHFGQSEPETEEQAKPYVCPECQNEGIERRFGSLSAMNTHRARKHNVPGARRKKTTRTRRQKPQQEQNAMATPEQMKELWDKLPSDLIHVSSAQSTFRAVMAQNTARSFILGIDNAQEEERGLSQSQRIDMLTMLLESYADGVVSGLDSLETEGKLFSLSKRHQAEKRS